MRGTATLLLLLPRAANACPTGWTPSPTSGTCFKVPNERSTSLFRCVELCKEHGGAPACIGSAEENAFVTEELAASNSLWLGLYQNETGLGPVPRGGVAAWVVTLPTLPAGTRASRTTITDTSTTARGSALAPGSGVLWRATAACASTLSRGG